MRAPSRAGRLCQVGLQSPLLMEWIAGRYGEQSLLKWRGAHYPARILSSNSLRIREQTTPPIEVSERLISPLYLRWGAVSHDGVIHRLLRVEGQTLHVSRCGYFDMLDTRDALEWELLASLGEIVAAGKRPTWREFESRLTLRHNVESGHCESAAGVGVSLVVRRRVGRGWQTLAARRRQSRIGSRSGKLHVVPAGMLMPGKTVRQTALQELLEELLGLDEHGRGISREPEYRRLIRAGAVFATTGYVTNLLNLCGDVCATLTIDDPNWWDREPSWRLNYEHGGGLTAIDGTPPWWDIIPQGAAALALAESSS